ncbi:asparagine synthase C-terminal domain-containing protein [Candidatus Woesearchaeota archaeon]|nr:asparagine synthase C-terminal domain-containing protein [Candidatus Woesearchaeota archaeon]
MVEELFLLEGALVDKSEWDTRIAGLKAGLSEDLDLKDDARKAVRDAIVNAVLSRIPEDRPFGVMFSGGVDSSLIAHIAKKSGKEFFCYTVGFKDDETKSPEDLEAAEVAARLMGVNLKSRVFSLDESEALINNTVKILGPELSNVVNVGVGAVVVGCVELAAKDGVKILFSGLGSEEVFAGYERHKKADDRQAECWSGLFNMYERDLLRDAAIAKATGASFMTPFLDPELIKTAMRVPAKHKINDSQAKIILRDAAEEAGLPKEVSQRKKRAAQYGSRLDKAIDKLARKKGFEFKKDYLKSLS